MSEIVMSRLINDLKENEEDYEFYPTTDEMLSAIAPYMECETVLDIGCGYGKFKIYMDKEAELLAQRKTEASKKDSLENGYSNWKEYTATDNACCKIDKYFIIEKSTTLLNKIPNDAICLGIDFNSTNLIDKKVSTIFCNPPYSEFEDWMIKIISQGFFTKQAFLVVPVRWQTNEHINSMLEAYRTQATVLGEFDFNQPNAERQARAKVHVVRLTRIKERYIRDDEKVNSDAFDVFFRETFGREVKKKYDYDLRKEFTDRVESNLKTALDANPKSKGQIIIDMYNRDLEKLYNNLKAIMVLDDDIMSTFNISVDNIKTALMEKMEGLKTTYWNLVWDEVDLVTERLTTDTRRLLKDKYEKLYCMDLSIENIWVVIMYVLKHANDYYDTQLINFYTKLSDEKNVKPYKSNQRLFESSGWYWNYKEHNDYYLDYRMIMSSPFRETWNGNFAADDGSKTTINDILIIARNLGFDTDENYILPSDFNEKAYVYFKDTYKGKNKIFMEYRAYKNGNMHIKFNQDFTKALNIEAARLLGWIKSPQDIVREFPEEYVDVAEKYFKANYRCTGRNIGLLPKLAD